MSHTIWTEDDETIDLGDSFKVLKVFAELERLLGEDIQHFEELRFVPHTGAESLPDEWFADVRQQAIAARARLQGRLSTDADEILGVLIAEVDAYFRPGRPRERRGVRICIHRGSREIGGSCVEF